MMITERSTLCKHLRRPQKKMVDKKGLLREPRNPRERQAFVWSEKAFTNQFSFQGSLIFFRILFRSLLEKDTNLANRCSAYVTWIYGLFFLEKGREVPKSVASQIVLSQRGFGVVFGFKFDEQLDS